MSAIQKKAAVIGYPVSHSLSPRLHGYWLKELNIAGAYDAIAVEPGRLETAFRDCVARGLYGFNLTVPHKEAALALMDRLDENAKRIGAVNTVVIHADGTLEGRNTDAFGFAQNLLAAGYKPDARPVTILGAGGAARAAIVALQDLGARDIRIVNRTASKAKALAEEFSTMQQAHFTEDADHADITEGALHTVSPFGWGDPGALRGISLLVNATTLGMKGQPPLDIDLNALPKSATVTDMVYAPLKTELLKAAESRGNKTVDGLGMLLHQARPAFRAFFGAEPEVTPELRAHMLEAL